MVDRIAKIVIIISLVFLFLPLSVNSQPYTSPKKSAYYQKVVHRGPYHREGAWERHHYHNYHHPHKHWVPEHWVYDPKTHRKLWIPGHWERR